jgi:hypothetical protein
MTQKHYTPMLLECTLFLLGNLFPVGNCYFKTTFDPSQENLKL